jgi:hypothetical protein
MDSKVFEIASKVSTPLGLAGIFAVILFYLLKQVLGSLKKGQQYQHSNFKILKSIVDKLFILALVAMCLGFIGWVVTKVYSPPIINTSKQAYLNFNIYVNNKPVEGVKVTIDNVFPNPPSKTSTRDGQISMSFDTTGQNKRLHLIFTGDLYNINENRTVLLDTFPTSFSFTDNKGNEVIESKKKKENSSVTEPSKEANLNPTNRSTSFITSTFYVSTSLSESITLSGLKIEGQNIIRLKGYYRFHSDGLAYPTSVQLCFFVDKSVLKCISIDVSTQKDIRLDQTIIISEAQHSQGKLQMTLQTLGLLNETDYLQFDNGISVMRR